MQDRMHDSPIGALRTKVLEKMELLYTASGSGFTSAMREQIGKQNESVVEIRNLTKIFHTENVLKGFNCDFYANEISCILGDSGSGTLFINILLGK